MCVKILKRRRQIMKKLVSFFVIALFLSIPLAANATTLTLVSVRLQVVGITWTMMVG
jgi:hypothetical protein